MSLFDFGIGKKQWIGFDNYIRLFQDEVFRRAMVNTFGFVIGVVPLVVIFSLFVACTVFYKRNWTASFFRATFYLPVVTSQVILSITWAWIFNPVNGIANFVLSVFKIPPVMWMSDERVTLIALVFVIVTWVVGQPIILFLAALGNIPATYYEAAEIDGASPWRRFRSITLPLISPTLLYVIVTSTIGAFNTFIVVKMLSGGGPNYATMTIKYLLYETAFAYGELGLASTMGVILAAIICIISIIQFKFLKTDFEY
jgi:multiple sugar transport system permease protein